MTDIVEKLLEGTNGSDVAKTDSYLNGLMAEAAAEITRLRAENERLLAENKVLNKLGDDFAMLIINVERQLIKGRDEILSSAYAALEGDIDE